MKRQKWRWWKLARRVVGVSPRLFMLEYLVSAAYGVALACTPMVMERAFDAVGEFYRGRIGWGLMLGWLGGLFGILILTEVVAGSSDYLGETYSDLTAQKLFLSINQKIDRLPVIYFEDPQVLNHIQKSYGGASAARQAVHTMMDLLTMYLPYFVIYAWYLYRSSPILPVAMLLIFLPVLLVQKCNKKVYAAQEDALAPVQRSKDTFLAYLADKDAAKETRILGATDAFLKKVDDLQRGIHQILRKNDQKIRHADILAIVTNLLGYFLLLVLLLHFVRTGRVSISAFVAIFASVRTAYEQMEEAFGDRMAALSEAMAKAEAYLAFLELEEADLPEAEEKTIRSVCAENLGFAYPDGTQALKGLEFSINRGECIAVVGENGSGKSTLAKLLAGLCQPTEGRFAVNGGETSLQRCQGQISQCFQKFCRYQLTVGENVRISQWENANEEKILEELARTHFQMEQWDLNTLLGRGFGGTELSGGQWQRLALSRANFRGSSLLILDEPTAAIDPLQEGQLYGAFQDSCRGKIGVIITHRLGIVKLCQKVLVLRDGEQVDFGSHEELMLRCPYYRQLWRSQADMYA